ncbi:MAG: hypothetical protein WAQ28_03490 [Bacteroidia bacterium]
MNLQTHPEIFERHPELAALVDMLLDAELEYKDFKKAHEKANKDHPDIKKRTYQGRAKSYGKIAKYYKAGTWHFPPSNPMLGSDFEKELDRVLALKPDKITIDLYKGSTLSSLKTDSRKFDITDHAVDVKEPESETKLNGLGEFNQQLTLLQDTVNKMKSTPQVDSDGKLNVQLTEMQRQFDMQLLEMKHSSALREKEFMWERKEEKYLREIEDLKEEIVYLEEELEENNNALNGITEEREKKHIEENSFGRVIERLGTKVLTGILVENPTILKKGLGMTDADIQEWISKDVKSVDGAEEQPRAEDNSGFKKKSPSNDIFAGLDGNYLEGVQQILGFCKQIGPEAFQKVYEIFCCLQDEKTGMLDDEMAKRLMKASLEDSAAV